METCGHTGTCFRIFHRGLWKQGLDGNVLVIDADKTAGPFELLVKDQRGVLARVAASLGR